MTDPQPADPRRAEPPALWQPEELLALHHVPPAAPVAAPTPPASRAEAGSAEDVDLDGQITRVTAQLAPGSPPDGPGQVVLPVAVLGPRELEPYLALHPHGGEHRGQKVIAVDHDGRPARGERGKWPYTAPGLQGWCPCGWTGAIHPQTPVPAEHDRTPVRGRAWEHLNRAARRAIDLEWLDHVHLVVPSLGVTVLHRQLTIIERMLDEAVEHARRHGVPWQEIGHEAGMSRQSAHQRWRHLDPPPADIETSSTGGPHAPRRLPDTTRRERGEHRG